MGHSERTPVRRNRPHLMPRLRPVGGEHHPQRNHHPLRILLLIVLIAGAFYSIYHLYSGDPASPTVINEDGEEVLSPERQAKLDRELEEIDNAVQYALLADNDGYYPCYSCLDGKTTIFLYRGEVWKYGTSRISEQRRYPGKNYGAPNLSRIVQFEGTYGNCLKREKIMIYNYPLLKESRKRSFRLFRPPGNKYDS